MGSNPTSPIAPARVRVLLLPAGRIKSGKFQSFVSRLWHENVIRLGDISPDVRSDRSMIAFLLTMLGLGALLTKGFTAAFSPVAFPNGAIFYDFVVSTPPAHHLELYPFEFFRESLLVLSVADYGELGDAEIDDPEHVLGDANGSVSGRQLLEKDIQRCRAEFSRAILVLPVLFDVPPSDGTTNLPVGAVSVPPPEQSKSTTIKTIMCDISAMLLAEMTVAVQSIQDLVPVEPTISFTVSMHDAGSSTQSVNTIKNNSSRSDANRSPSPSSSDNPAQKLEQFAEKVRIATRPITPNEISQTSPPGNGASSFDNVAESIGRTRNSEPAQGSNRDSRPIAASSYNTALEREKAKLKARQGVISGSMYLLAGRWPDALRELVDNTTRSKTLGDHLWHAMGLENIIVTLILLAWSGLEFSIPLICTSAVEKSSGVKHSHAPSTSSVADIRPSTDSTNKRAMQNLSSVLPNVLRTICDLRTRAVESTKDQSALYSFSACTVRLGWMLSALHVTGGHLNHTALQSVIVGGKRLSAMKPKRAISAQSLKGDVCSLLFRGYPLAGGELTLSVPDTVMILSGMASVLATVGLQRKQAMVCKDMVSILVPAFIQARKVGAAEVGIHPAATLSIFQGFDVEASPNRLIPDEANVVHSFQPLLDLLCRTYGVVGYQRAATKSKSRHSRTNRESALQPSVAPPGTIDDSKQRFFGSSTIKMEILRLCANVSESLPNFRNVLLFTSMLFRNACVSDELAFHGLSRAHSASLAAEDQVRLVTKIYRTIDVIGEEDISDLETAYWDSHLVRSVSLRGSSASHSLFIHKKKVSSGPFLHDALSKPTVVDNSAETLVADETSEFIVTLQNPFDFEVLVESMSLVVEGCKVDQDPQGFILGPGIVQKILMSITPRSSGELRITSCRVKIRGCHGQDFPILHRPWSYAKVNKIKSTGLESLEDPARPNSTASDSKSDGSGATNEPSVSPAALSFTVLPTQPLLEVQPASLPQLSLNLLEGELKKFSVVLKNLSSLVSADFILPSCRDHLLGGTRKPLAGEEDHPGSPIPPVRLVNTRGHQLLHLEPQNCSFFNVEIFGVVGLSEATISFDYAHVGVPMTEITEDIFARRTVIQFAITVEPSIQLQRSDAVLLRSDSPRIDQKLTMNGSEMKHHENESEERRMDKAAARNIDAERASKFMLLLDLRNAWTKQLSVTFYSPQPNSMVSRNADSEVLAKQMVLPGQFARITLAFDQIIFDDRMDPTATTDGGAEGQTTDKSSPPGHGQPTSKIMASRSKLLRLFDGWWEEVGSGRRGRVNLQDLRLNQRMTNAIHQDEVAISMKFHEIIETPRSERSTTYIQARQNKFMQVDVRLENRTMRPISGVFQLKLRLAGHHWMAESEAVKHIVWTGSLRRRLLTIDPCSSVEVQIGLGVLNPGIYELLAVVSESLQDKAGPSINTAAHAHLGTSFVTLTVLVDET